jgi:RNA polymerase sigma-70 factor (ECF subfamily)
MIDANCKPQSDEDLARRAADGCLASFEQLVERFQVPLVHFLSRSVAHEDAEDLTQETFVRAFKNLHRYHAKWRFSTWLFTIARRLCINHLRQRSVRQVTNGPSTEALGEMKGPAAEPGEMLAAREQRQRIWDQAAEVLSEPKFTALWLFYVEDMPVRDIASVLGRSRVAVKTMMFRARQELLPIMKDGHAAGAHGLCGADFEVSFLARIKTKLLVPALSPKRPAAAAS